MLKKREGDYRIRKQKLNFQAFPDSLNAFCIKCNAWLGELGNESHFNHYIDNLEIVFRGVHRILKDTGTVWVNITDTYFSKGFSGEVGRKRFGKYPTKSMSLIPERFKTMMVDKLGFLCINDIIWHKPNAFPESVKNRLARVFESVILFAKTDDHYFDLDSVRVQVESADKRNKSHPLGKNPGNVWSINTQAYKGAHYAAYPQELCRMPILARCPEGGLVYDPFIGSGVTALVAAENDRNWLGCELIPSHIELSQKRFSLKGNISTMWGKDLTDLFEPLPKEVLQNVRKRKS